jgi:hypothetical protein
MWGKAARLKRAQGIGAIPDTVDSCHLAGLPIVIGGSRPGHEIEHPMAVVIVGGLVTSTVLNLGLVPALYLRYGRSVTRADARNVKAPVTVWTADGSEVPVNP